MRGGGLPYAAGRGTHRARRAGGAELNGSQAGRSEAQRWPLLRSLAPPALLGAAYYLAAQLGLMVAVVEENVTPLWPPTGIAVVGILLFGRRVAVGVAVAALLVNAPITTALWAAGLTAVGNTLAPLAAAGALRLLGFRPELDRARDAVAIVAAALGGMLISATVGAGTLVISDAIPPAEFAGAWAVWWTGDAMGVLVVAPFLLGVRRLGEPLTWPRRVELAVWIAVVFAVAALVLRAELPLLFLVIPLLGWTAWRFQMRGSAPAALIVAGFAAWAASRNLGKFGEGDLVDRMISLQAFNATAALTSFFFSAVVAERQRSRAALERSAAQLEARVEERTETLRQRERQLAEAQEVARVGSWEWLIPEDRVRWSDEMYRIHGHPPQAFPLTMDAALSFVAAEDVDAIRRNVEGAFARGEDHELPHVEYRIVRADGEERSLIGRGRVAFAADGSPLRMVGIVQDVTDSKRAEREHRVAETLQRSLLPDRLPSMPGVVLAARYVPATADLEVGGDWYDVIQLPNGFLGAAIGDVAGHGLLAASTMGQLRMSVRAYALSEDSPAAVLASTRRLLHRVAPTEMATALYLVLNPDTGEIRFSNAGHPPPLLVDPDGNARFLRTALAPPLGPMAYSDVQAEASETLDPGATLVLYTDGLVERRGVSLEDGLARLAHEAADAGSDAESIGERLLLEFLGEEVEDDVALLVLRYERLGDGPLAFRLPAEPSSLAPIRHTLRRWLREHDASVEETHDVLLAVGEACANVIQHAYGAKEGTLDLGLAIDGRDLRITVADSGGWREASGAEGGHGLPLMSRLMDEVDLERRPDGTVVTLRRALRAGASA